MSANIHASLNGVIDNGDGYVYHLPWEARLFCPGPGVHGRVRFCRRG